jgi:hypothetical protein
MKNNGIQRINSFHKSPFYAILEDVQIKNHEVKENVRISRK